jgi:hypothetical protein
MIGNEVFEFAIRGGRPSHFSSLIFNLTTAGKALS